MSILHRLKGNVTVYTVRAGIPKLYCKAYISPKRPVLDLRRLKNPKVRLIFDKRLYWSLSDGRVIISGAKKKYLLTLGEGLSPELWIE